MKFHTLAINNFLTVGSAVVRLKDKGLHLIQGENEDNSSALSNGAGKSSIVDAISWALFGVTARGVKGDKVVHRERKKDCWAGLTIEHGATTYKVTRYRKHSEGKNSLRLSVFTEDLTAHPTGLIDVTKGTDAETQKALEDILGCSYEVFKAAVYCGQEEMPDLPKKTDKELKTLVEEAAGLKRIERAYEIARERLATAKSAGAIAQTRVDSNATTLARIESNLDLARTERDSWETGRAERVAAAKRQVDEWETKLRADGTALLARKPGMEAGKLRMAEIDVQLADHGRLNAAAIAADRDFNRLNMAVDRAGLAAAQKKVEGFDYAISNVDAAMAIPCEACGKPHTAEEKESYLAHQKDLRDRANRALTDKKAEVTTQVKAAAAAKTAAEAARAAVPDVSAISAERASLAATVKAYDDSLAALARVRATVDANKATLALRETESNPKADTVAMLEKQLAEETGNKAALTEALDKAKQKLEIAEAVVKVYGPAGVRAQILDTVTPFLNARTADYLSVLTDGHTQAVWTTLTKGASGDLKEKFSIEVTDDQGADCFEGLSGGEKKKVRLATALGLQDLVASRATQPIDLWIGDEVDEALDAAGLERLMTLLERKARERGTVLVISHNELRDWVDEVTIVRKKGGVAAVEGSLCV